MQVNQSVFQAGVSEQDLDGAQVGSSVQQMGSATVPQTVWRQAFADAGLPGCLATSQPDDVGSDGYVSPPVVHGSGEEIGFRFHPTPIDAEASSSVGLSGTSRSRLPLPWVIRII